MYCQLRILLEKPPSSEKTKIYLKDLEEKISNFQAISKKAEGKELWTFLENHVKD
jgi:hypothetical protein